jgi:MFS transporter, ACS family, solute carrier family 17 (sodium-dependent inorganic phosphate cotransporter), other
VILSLMGFLAIVNAYTMRICLNVAITEMVKKKVLGGGDNSTDLEGYCPEDPSYDPNAETGGDFEWTEAQQGLVLSAFFWGYVITHLPGGYLAERFGGKYTLSLGILSTAIFTLITPITIEWGGLWALFVLRFLEGLGEGTTFPALSALLATWIPVKERSKLGSLVFGGGQVRLSCLVVSSYTYLTVVND